VHAADLSQNNFDFFLDSLSDTQIDHFVESASSQQGGIKQVRAVSCPNNKKAWFFTNPIDLGQQLSHYPIHHLRAGA
jgi:hypothetical protein